MDALDAAHVLGELDGHGTLSRPEIAARAHDLGRVLCIMAPFVTNPIPCRCPNTAMS